MGIHNSRSAREVADQRMADGTQQHLSQVASLPVGSATYTPAEIVQIFKDRVASSQAATAAAAHHPAAVKADTQKPAQTATAARAFRRMVQSMFSESPDTLATFGLTAPKVATKTVATKSSAVAKSKATRAARHTMGPKQKAAIHGTPASASSDSPVSPGPAPQAITTTPAAPAPATTAATPAPAAVTSR